MDRADRVDRAAVEAIATRWAAGFDAVAAAHVVDGHGRVAEREATTALARRLLVGVLGSAGAAHLLVRTDAGRPCWPPGVRASLAHAGGVAVGVAAASARCRALGVDLEREGALPVIDADVVLGPHERRWVGAAAASTRAAATAVADRWATRLWSAKEAAFKAWCGALDDDLAGVDPLDVEVWPGVDRGTFAVRSSGALSARVGALGPASGRWLAVPGSDLVLTIVWR